VRRANQNDFRLHALIDFASNSAKKSPLQNYRSNVRPSVKVRYSGVFDHRAEKALALNPARLEDFR
jgi:hypothetical protein